MPKVSSKLKKPLQRPKGTYDILPDDQKYWEKARKVVKNIALSYGFERIDTPVIEYSDLYAASVGAATDIIEKQMYSFKSRGGDMLSLRPEWTAGVMRAFIENGMVNLSQPVKLYSFGPIFRYEQPQAGRYRQFFQANLEAIGSVDPIYDAQMISAFLIICNELGLKNLKVEINSIGCGKCRPPFRNQLLRYYKPRFTKLCKDCKRRLKDNPLRLLDCKEETCQELKANAPNLIDNLCEDCHDHFKSVLEYLDETEVPYALNLHLVRGLDYYTKTVFEVFLEDEHLNNGDEKTHQRSKLALGGGGRYDELSKLLGGRDVPAVGAGIGIDRVIEAMKSQNVKIAPLLRPEIFLVQLGSLSKKKCLKLFEELRKDGLSVAEAFGKDSIKAQLKAADRLGVKISLILGQKEVVDGMIIVREMDSGAQESVPIEKVIKVVREKLKK